MPSMQPNKPPKSGWIKFGEYYSLAFVLPSSVAAGWIIGTLLDRWLGTSYLYLVCLLLGIAGGMIHVIRFAQRDKDSS